MEGVGDAILAGLGGAILIALIVGMVLGGACVYAVSRATGYRIHIEKVK